MADKPIRFSKHALFEMKRRAISRSSARATIRSAGKVVPSKKRAGDLLIGRLLWRVIVKEDGNAYHVLTVCETSKIKKYWREW